MDAATEFRSKILRRASEPEEYRTYRAGLEWDLTDPIVLESAADFKSSPRWQDRLIPYHHQVTNLITFCRRLPVTLLADDVGLGKTISAGLIISELVARARVSKILIVCPKLLGPQWKAELSEKFNISAEIAIGRKLVKADPKGTGAVITTYASARLHLGKIPEDRFQMLILDEAHKLRNLFGVANTPQVAKTFRKALEDRRFRFVLMLTATPIQNRLWDLYSLVDLLTVARGHENPFGSPGIFARRYIADGRDQARQLKPEAREEFRSIVYGYMSRVRRGDAKLYFPDRVVQMHRVDPTRAELDLIEVISEPIQKLNRLAQISILQALTSSPDALSAQLQNMARNSTIPAELAETVRAIVSRMPLSAKLQGLGRLIEQLKKENLERWRLVIFTGRRETQTTIQAFLEGHGLKVGIINGDSGDRNQETIERFRQNPPDLRVIVSTEAGSEGVNLQVANVLVNYDLPWNPMIVEQRIGRVQRLASEHAHVSIFNIMLKGTFEEYIVGQLMAKLQMATHAIGDLEALLQGSDIGDAEDDQSANFEERILKLVLAALAGKDVDKDAELAAQSIEEAKVKLEREEATINEMLGSTDGAEYVGPRAPTLPPVSRSMSPREFTLAGLKMLGVLTPTPPDLYLAEENGGREYIRFTEHPAGNLRSTFYTPGSGAFQRLVGRVIATGIHEVDDLDHQPGRASEEIVRRWIEEFGAKPRSIEAVEGRRAFDGEALVPVRATVAHDSYERLVDVPCGATDHSQANGRAALAHLERTIEDPTKVGVDLEKLTDVAVADKAISEFSRFYLERRDLEVAAAADDERKRRKLQEDFTPRLSMTLAGLRGTVHREVEVRARYAFDGEAGYESILTVVPLLEQVVDAPTMGLCAKSGRTVPSSCLSRCEISGEEVLRHLLVKSEASGRLALPEFGVVCALSGKHVLKDEADQPAVTGRLVWSALLKTSAQSGMRAEPEHFGRCAFTGADLLNSELATSELSGKRYRADQAMRSAVSGRAGHREEFIECQETRQPIARTEAEQCEVTGKYVRTGILRVCDMTHKRVLPSELERCVATGKLALKGLFVTSSVSHARVLEEIATRSAAGNYCTPDEAVTCFWSGQKSHPDDLRICALTGLTVRVEFTGGDQPPRLRPLMEMLDGTRRNADESGRWEAIATALTAALKGGKVRIEAAVLSPYGRHLAFAAEVRKLLGLRSTIAGGVYSLENDRLVGRISQGKRTKERWVGFDG